MDNILKEFENYCKNPDVESGKAASYSNAIKYLCDFLNINIIDENTVLKFKNMQSEIRNKNSDFYNDFLSFLEDRKQGSYLSNGYVKAALTPFFKFWQIRNKEKRQQNWFISCDGWFLIDDAFKKVQKLEWLQNRFLMGMKQGDFVYIYKTKPDAEIKYKGIVTKTRIKQSELQADDGSFTIEGDSRDYKDSDLYFEFEFCSELPKQKITLEMLREWDFKYTQSTIIPDIVASKIESLFDIELLDNDSDEVQERIQQTEPATSQQAKDSSNRKLQLSGNKNSEAVIKENKYSKYVLKESNYNCQIDKSHITFLTNKNVQYMEGHHLIPCTVNNAKYFISKYNKNIDCVENIVCICPTYHRAVHFGDWKIKESLIKIMFDQQKEKLKETGIIITEEQLLNLYKNKKGQHFV